MFWTTGSGSKSARVLHGNSEAGRRGSEVGSAPCYGCFLAFSLLHPGALGEVLLPLSLLPRYILLHLLLSSPCFRLQIPLFNLCIFAVAVSSIRISFPFLFLPLLIKTHPSRLSSNVTHSRKPSRCLPQAELTLLSVPGIAQFSHLSLPWVRAGISFCVSHSYGITQST